MTDVKIVNQSDDCCPACKGSTRRIVDWHAYNQLSMPVGLSSYARAQWEDNFKKAYGPCPACQGTGKAKPAS